MVTINEGRRILGLDGSLEGGDTAVTSAATGASIKVSDLPNLPSFPQMLGDNSNPESPQMPLDIELDLQDPTTEE